jgi:alpha-beta hydrolase superfamily lysophospholipase
VTAPGDHPLHALAAADGAELLYRRYPAAGERRGAIVYLHGIQSHGGWYVDAAAEFASRGYSVYLTDRRGSGTSKEPRGHFDDRAQLVGDVGSFVELAHEQEGSPVFLVGGCWGARPAVTYALESQERLAGLALVTPALKAKVDLSPAEKAKVVVGGVLRPRAKVRIPLTPELFTRQPRWLAFIREDPLALQEVTASFFLKQALWDRYLSGRTGLRLPILLLQSGRDEIVDNEAVLAWVEKQESQSKQHIVYPEFDHLLDFEPERSRYWDDLTGWLDELSSQRAGTAAEAARA